MGTTAQELALTGQLLVAMPGMADTRFQQSVVFLCNHSEDGAMGLIVNKPEAGITFAKLLDQMGISVSPAARDVRVYFGGPVDHQRGFVLHSNDYASDNGTLDVDDNYRMTATVEVLEDLAKLLG